MWIRSSLIASFCLLAAIGAKADGIINPGSSSSGGSGTVTSVSFTGGLIIVGTPTTTPTLTISGATSGVIPYFDSPTHWSSSAALTANALVIGGGAGAAPSTVGVGLGLQITGGNLVLGNGVGISYAEASSSGQLALLGASSKLAIAGTGTCAGTGSVPALSVGNSGTGIYGSASAFCVTVNGVDVLDYNISRGTAWQFLGGSNGNVFLGNLNVTALGTINIGSEPLTSPATGTLQQGASDSAAPVAQAFTAQNVVAGTTNTNGANRTIVGSLSTGSGTSGDISLLTGGTGAGATVQNSAVTALTIKGGTQRVVAAATVGTAGYAIASLPTTGFLVGDRAYVTDQLTTCAAVGVALTAGGSVKCPVFYNGSTWVGG